MTVTRILDNLNNLYNQQGWGVEIAQLVYELGYGLDVGRIVVRFPEKALVDDISKPFGPTDSGGPSSLRFNM